ncbi:AraC family transcriptional regulator [Pseudomonas sp. FW300-N1A1]|uniref:AraC family transcriptional regulator n=1 Tax=Pseudomonas sp. FW300-N1A1 TaxID=2075555 RepID=UPI002115A87E|nr:AraC family transcriptional regulator [Pseudomonas sp. FW300-N1A1]
MPKTVPRHRNNPSPGADLRDPAADVFFEVFSLARMRGELLGAVTVRPGESLRRPAGQACFHVVHEGACRLRLEDASESVQLAPGDIIFVPHGQRHRIDADALVVQPGEAVRITSGVFQFEGTGGQALMLGLPALLHVTCLQDAKSDDVGSREWLSLTIAAMQKEVQSPSIGSAVMLSRIIDLMFIWAVRHWLARAPEGAGGWIVALRDPVIGHALALLHAEPGAEWTVERLAAQVKQSRSNLASHFARLVGTSPMRYLAHWRMQLASQHLLSSNRRISQIAEALGYQSESAFSRAFRREFNLAPGEYRARQGQSVE